MLRKRVAVCLPNAKKKEEEEEEKAEKEVQIIWNKDAALFNDVSLFKSVRKMKSYHPTLQHVP